MPNLSLLKMQKRVKAPHPPTVKEKPVDLSKLTKAKLLSYAEDKGYDISEDLTKAEVLAEIKKLDG